MANSCCTCAPKQELALKRPPGCATGSITHLRSSIPHTETRQHYGQHRDAVQLHQLHLQTPGLTGSHEADILVSLKENHRPTADYVRQLRKDLPREFPGTSFYFLPPDIVTQILNFGLPAPVDIQFDGTNIEGNRAVADRVLEQLRQVPGTGRPANPAGIRSAEAAYRRWTAPRLRRRASPRAISPAAC